jgi:hypothetical protein
LLANYNYAQVHSSSATWQYKTPHPHPFIDLFFHDWKPSRGTPLKKNHPRHHFCARRPNFKLGSPAFSTLPLMTSMNQSAGFLAAAPATAGSRAGAAHQC